MDKNTTDLRAVFSTVGECILGDISIFSMTNQRLCALCSLFIAVKLYYMRGFSISPVL
jgi:hypothetical protein